MGTLNVVFSCKQPSINVYINSFYVDFFVECFFYAVTLREKSGKKDFVFFCVCGGWEVVSTSLMGILTNRNTIYIYNLKIWQPLRSLHVRLNAPTGKTTGEHVQSH